MLRRAASLGSGAYGGGWRGEDAVGACTESLGSETGDVGGDSEIDHQLGQQRAGEDEEEDERDEPHQTVVPSPEKRPRRGLPPPMPRAAEGAFSMRAERRGGRLILTEVRVEQRRREVFRAERAGGRLRLQFSADRERSRSPDGGEPGPAAGAEVGGGCCNGGASEFCQVAVEARRSRVEIGAVMGT